MGAQIEGVDVIDRYRLDIAPYEASARQWHTLTDGMGAALNPLLGKLQLVELSAAGVGAAAISMAGEVGGAFQDLEQRTGAASDALRGMEQQVTELAAKSPESFGEIADAVGMISQRLGESGADAEHTGEQYLNLARIWHESVGATAGAGVRMQQTWSVGADAVNQVGAAAQQAYLPASQLMQAMDAYGPSLKRMGYGFQDSLALIGNMEQKGIGFARVFNATRIALPAVGFDDAKLQQQLQHLRELDKAGDMAGLESSAKKLFGGKAWLDVVEAIHRGGFETQAFAQSLRGAGDVAEQNSHLFGDQLKEALNQVSAAAKPLGDGLIAVLRDALPVVEHVTTAALQLAGAFTGNPAGKMLLELGLGLTALSAGVGVLDKLAKFSVAGVGKLAGGALNPRAGQTNIVQTITRRYVDVFQDARAGAMGGEATLAQARAQATLNAEKLRGVLATTNYTSATLRDALATKAAADATLIDARAKAESSALNLKLATAQEAKTRTTLEAAIDDTTLSEAELQLTADQSAAAISTLNAAKAADEKAQATFRATEADARQRAAVVQGIVADTGKSEAQLRAASTADADAAATLRLAEAEQKQAATAREAATATGAGAPTAPAKPSRLGKIIGGDASITQNTGATLANADAALVAARAEQQLAVARLRAAEAAVTESQFVTADANAELVAAQQAAQSANNRVLNLERRQSGSARLIGTTRELTGAEQQAAAANLQLAGAEELEAGASGGAAAANATNAASLAGVGAAATGATATVTVFGVTLKGLAASLAPMAAMVVAFQAVAGATSACSSALASWNNQADEFFESITKMNPALFGLQRFLSKATGGIIPDVKSNTEIYSKQITDKYQVKSNDKSTLIRGYQQMAREIDAEEKNAWRLKGTRQGAEKAAYLAELKKQQGEIGTELQRQHVSADEMEGKTPDAPAKPATADDTRLEPELLATLQAESAERATQEHQQQRRHQLAITQLQAEAALFGDLWGAAYGSQRKAQAELAGAQLDHDTALAENKRKLNAELAKLEVQATWHHEQKDAIEQQKRELRAQSADVANEAALKLSEKKVTVDVELRKASLDIFKESMQHAFDHTILDPRFKQGYQRAFEGAGGAMNRVAHLTAPGAGLAQIGTAGAPSLPTPAVTLPAGYTAPPLRIPAPAVSVPTMTAPQLTVPAPAVAVGAPVYHAPALTAPHIGVPAPSYQPAAFSAPAVGVPAPSYQMPTMSAPPLAIPAPAVHAPDMKAAEIRLSAPSVTIDAPSVTVNAPTVPPPAVSVPPPNYQLPDVTAPAYGVPGAQYEMPLQAPPSVRVPAARHEMAKAEAPTVAVPAPSYALPTVAAPTIAAPAPTYQTPAQVAPHVIVPTATHALPPADAPTVAVPAPKYALPAIPKPDIAAGALSTAATKTPPAATAATNNAPDTPKPRKNNRYSISDQRAPAVPFAVDATTLAADRATNPARLPVDRHDYWEIGARSPRGSRELHTDDQPRPFSPLPHAREILPQPVEQLPVATGGRDHGTGRPTLQIVRLELSPALVAQAIQKAKDGAVLEVKQAITGS